MPDANDPLVYETIETPAPAARKGFDYIQLGFWAGAGGCGRRGGHGADLERGGRAGGRGAGDRAGRDGAGAGAVGDARGGAGSSACSRNAARRRRLRNRPSDTVWLEALTEPALISDRGGATVAANASLSRDRAARARSPATARMRRRSTACSASNPGMAAPIYRLSKAVKLGVAQDGDAARPAVRRQPHGRCSSRRASPRSGKTRALWRLRRVEAGSAAAGAGSVDPRALYVGGRAGRLLLGAPRWPRRLYQPDAAPDARPAG